MKAKIKIKVRKGLPASLTCQKPHGPKSGKKTYSRKNSKNLSDNHE